MFFICFDQIVFCHPTFLSAHKMCCNSWQRLLSDSMKQLTAFPSRTSPRLAHKNLYVSKTLMLNNMKKLTCLFFQHNIQPPAALTSKSDDCYLRTMCGGSDNILGTLANRYLTDRGMDNPRCFPIKPHKHHMKSLLRTREPQSSDSPSSTQKHSHVILTTDFFYHICSPLTDS